MDRLLKWTLVALGAAQAVAGAAHPRPPAAPIYDPVALNIGLNCRWQARCMAMQQGAMKRATGFVRNKRPAIWRIHQCNRNASRGRYRVDWVGYDNCIRNMALRPTPLPRTGIRNRQRLSRR